MASAPFKIGIAEDIELIDYDSYIEIVLKYYPLLGIFLWIFMTTIFTVAAFFFWGLLLLDTPTEGLRILWHVNIFMISVVLTAVLGTLYAFDSSLNNKHIFISHEFISVRHRPLPWFGNKDIKSTNVIRIYAITLITGIPDQYGNQPPENHIVQALKNNGEHVKIIDGINKYENAELIAKEIEKYLLVVNAPVPD